MWKDLSNASDGQMILDVIEWLSRASLDVWVPSSHDVPVLFD